MTDIQSISDELFPKHKYSNTILFLVQNKILFSEDIFKTIAEGNPNVRENYPGEFWNTTYFEVLEKLVVSKVISLRDKTDKDWFYWNPMVTNYDFSDFSQIYDIETGELESEPLHNICGHGLDTFLFGKAYLTIEKTINTPPEIIKKNILIDVNTKFKPEYICDRKKDRIISVPKVLYNKLPVEDRTCSICLNITEYDKCDLLICNHMFHHDCIEKALEQNHICPLCRSDIPLFD